MFLCTLNMTNIMFFLPAGTLYSQYRLSDTRLCLVATGNLVTVQSEGSWETGC
ncbi:hypothetical protein ES703_55141 [subsurface metagenome]